MPVRDRSTLYISIIASFCVLSLLLVVARLVSCQMKFHLDDAMLVAAWLLSMPASIMAGILVKNGMGKDVWEVSQDSFDTYFLATWLAIWSFCVATAFVKIALLTFYIRIFPSRRFRIVAWIMVGSVALWGMSTTLTVVFHCWPVDYAWRQWDAEYKGKCIPLGPIVLSHSALTMVTDLAILFLPMPTLYKLHVNWKKKLQLFGKGPRAPRSSSGLAPFWEAMLSNRRTQPQVDRADIWSIQSCSVSAWSWSL